MERNMHYNNNRMRLSERGKEEDASIFAFGFFVLRRDAFVQMPQMIRLRAGPPAYNDV